MRRIQDLSNGELLERLLAVGREELAETMLQLARQHPRNARIVQQLLTIHDAAYMAQLPDEEPIPARPSGVSDLAYADQVAAALNEQSGLISDEDQPAFRAGLAGVLDLLEGEQRQPEEALAIAWRIECSADNLRGRSAARWPEVGALVCSRSREVQAALLRRIGDMQLVQEALFERFMALDGVPDDELEKLAGELLPEAELAGLIEDLLSDVRLSGNPLSGAAMLLSVAGLAARLPDPELYLELREELEEFGAELPEDPALYSS